ncbi:Nitrous oxide reductase maturation protein, outer-membrane lipoprotein NosL [Castellaniella defragrans 65Phen]|uniref:Nitrous oxide reductase maturation protein, outer-membrane lipoprotein NosL n=2 Tax=Castellaniella defragrans TaxID=75697 RepID=W8WZA1_CASD6|nr:Nitrous oxide reductase maturation protein, outer-membrane lipoprotein NosL [Castellaniella defragrans 65Phen]
MNAPDHSRLPGSAMKTRAARLLGAALLAAALAGCGDGGVTSSLPPSPVAMTDDAVGHYCGMNLYEHIGPKGQILLRDRDVPVWFSTIRELFAYTILPEEPKAILALYVQDMGRAGPDGNPPADAWIDARTAHYLIESNAVGGMGAPDALPFARLEDARAYAERYGGRIVGFKDMPEDYVLRAPELSPLTTGREPVGAPS